MITVISIGNNFQIEQFADVYVPAFSWPPPSPALRQADGRDPTIQQLIITGNPVVKDALNIAADYALHLEPERDDVIVVLECSEGIHRSVAGAEWLGRCLRFRGAEDVRVFHRDVERRGSL